MVLGLEQNAVLASWCLRGASVRAGSGHLIVLKTGSFESILIRKIVNLQQQASWCIGVIDVRRGCLAELDNLLQLGVYRVTIAINSKLKSA